jgi:hypothetical protein
MNSQKKPQRFQKFHLKSQNSFLSFENQYMKCNKADITKKMSTLTVSYLIFECLLIHCMIHFQALSTKQSY